MKKATTAKTAAKPAKGEISNKISSKGLLQKDAMTNDVRVAKIGAKPRKWSKKAK
jgi:hypothetical protein